MFCSCMTPRFGACYYPAKKSSRPAVELVEGEEGVINLKKIEGAMSGAVEALKHEYTTAVSTRITPGVWEPTQTPKLMCGNSELLLIRTQGLNPQVSSSLDPTLPTLIASLLSVLKDLRLSNSLTPSVYRCHFLLPIKVDLVRCCNS